MATMVAIAPPVAANQKAAAKVTRRGRLLRNRKRVRSSAMRAVPGTARTNLMAAPAASSQSTSGATRYASP